MVKKVSKKSNKKVEVKPAYIVNLNGIYDPIETMLAFAEAKMYSVLRDDEVDLLVDAICNELIESLHIKVVKVEPAKKPNVFKRFWNWITRK